MLNTYIHLVCKTCPWSDASTIRQKLYLFIFSVHHHFTNGRVILAIQPGNLRIHFFFNISIISSIFTFSLMERTSQLLLGLEALQASLLLRFGAIITVQKGFLDKNTVITRQLIWTARMLGAEWWQVRGKAWVQQQRKMSQVLGVTGLLDFTTIRSILVWRVLWNLWTVYFFNFPNFFRAAVNRWWSGFSGLVVSMLASGIQVPGFKPDWCHQIFSGEKILSMPSFGEEVKPSVPCRSFAACKNSVHVQWKWHVVHKIELAISSPILPSLANRGLSRRWTWSASGDDGGN
jgi:hypothetical protein